MKDMTTVDRVMQAGVTMTIRGVYQRHEIPLDKIGEFLQDPLGYRACILGISRKGLVEWETCYPGDRWKDWPKRAIVEHLDEWLEIRNSGDNAELLALACGHQAWQMVFKGQKSVRCGACYTASCGRPKRTQHPQGE